MDHKLVTQLSRRIKLLTVGNTKIVKGMSKGYATAGLHLAPANESGYNTCAMHTAECAAACLNTSGHGAFATVQAARVRRTKMFFEDRSNFLRALHKDVAQFAENAGKLGLAPCYRMNLTSDIRWENYGVMQQQPADYIWYDYTKLDNRKNLPSNYHLTFSYSGHNLAACRTALANGMNVAVPFVKRPDTWLGHAVVDGDEDDLRFLGERPRVVALKPKGKLRSDPTSAFLGDHVS